MYDAKEVEKSQPDNYNPTLTEGHFIADRSYFQKVQNEKLTNLKSSHIPMDGLINNFDIE